VCESSGDNKTHIYHEIKGRNSVAAVQKLLMFPALPQNTIWVYIIHTNKQLIFLAYM
jgi:hypothetical protein